MIDLKSLQRVYLQERDSLPKRAGIYFVLFKEQILYIGKTDNPKGGLWIRWHKENYHKMRLLKDIPNADILEIAYFDRIPLRTHPKEIETFERALIWYFQPSLNWKPKAFEKAYHQIIKEGCSFFSKDFLSF